MGDVIKKLIPYTDQDYDSIMTSVIDSIPELTPEYNNYSETDVGMVILEENVKIADVLSWKVDVAMNEAIPGNAVTYKAVLPQCKWVGYVPKQNIASTVILTFTVLNNGEIVIIPKGTKVATGYTKDDVIFETKETVEASAPVEVGLNETYEVNVEAISGESVEEYIGTSNGKSGQTFRTSMTPYIYESIRLEVLSPDKTVVTGYFESKSLFEIKNEENKFVISFDENGLGDIKFGDGVNGNIPPNGSDIVAIYRVGGGEMSNVAIGMINTIVSNIDSRVLYVTNNDEAYGGQDKESVEHINENASSVLKIRNRLVSKEDCEEWAKNKPEIYDAYFEADATYLDLYWLYVLPYNILSTEYKTKMKSEIDKICMLGDDIRIADPIYKDVEISVEVKHSVLYDGDSITSAVFNEIKSIIGKKKLGETLDMSDIATIKTNVDGVIKISTTKLCLVSDLIDGVSDIDCANNEVVHLLNDTDIVVNVTL